MKKDWTDKIGKKFYWSKLYGGFVIFLAFLSYMEEVLLNLGLGRLRIALISIPFGILGGILVNHIARKR